MNDEMKCKVVPVSESHAIKARNRKGDINKYTPYCLDTRWMWSTGTNLSTHRPEI